MMLSTIFFRILKIDLKADTYEIIEHGDNDPLRECFQKESISECLMGLAEEGYIHEEDYKERQIPWETFADTMPTESNV